MAEEISNKTLAVIVVAAIVVTLGSTALILRMGAPVITGMVTEQTGTAQFNITSVIAIDIPGALVEFGAGSVVAEYEICYMDTGLGGAADDTGVVDATNCTWTTGAISNGFVIQNVGNVEIDVKVNSSESAATFIGGGSGNIADPVFQYATDTTAEGGDSVSCAGGTIASYTTVSTGAADLMCGNLTFGQTTNEVELDIRVGVPKDAVPEQKTVTMNFWATPSS